MWCTHRYCFFLVDSFLFLSLDLFTSAHIHTHVLPHRFITLLDPISCFLGYFSIEAKKQPLNKNSSSSPVRNLGKAHQCVVRACLGCLVISKRLIIQHISVLTNMMIKIIFIPLFLALRESPNKRRSRLSKLASNTEQEREFVTTPIIMKHDRGGILTSPMERRSYDPTPIPSFQSDTRLFFFLSMKISTIVDLFLLQFSTTSFNSPTESSKCLFK